MLNHSTYNKTFQILLFLIIWLLVRIVFFTGYMGADDRFYSYFAYHFDRIPVDHWEFRLPANLLLHLNFTIFGTSEIAACLPSLFSSLLIFLSALIFYDFNIQDFKTKAALLTLALFPLDVALSSYISANNIATGLLAVSTVLFLKQKSKLLTCLLISWAFLSYYNTFYYIAFLLLTSTIIDPKKYLKQSIYCTLSCCILFSLELLIYYFLYDNPFARLEVAFSAISKSSDPRSGNFFMFLLIPIKNMFLSKSFGFTLLIVFALGIYYRKALSFEHRFLLLFLAIYWFWINYGTTVPWKYKPLNRAIHYQYFLVLPVAILLPVLIEKFFLNTKSYFKWIALTLILAVNLALLSVGGRWGQEVEVAKKLLTYAQAHPNQKFITDVLTMNNMYLLNDFMLPENIVCREDQQAEKLLYRRGRNEFVKFNTDNVDAILYNKESFEFANTYSRLNEQGFLDYKDQHGGNVIHKFPKEYKMIFKPLIGLVPEKGIMVKNAGANVIEVKQE